MELEFSCKINAYFREISSIINLKEMQLCKIKTDKTTQGNGKIIKNMERANTLGQMAINTKDSISVEREKVLELCSIQMDKLMKETGLIV
jgi:hypothetical protein